jgi:hypothetical protein
MKKYAVNTGIFEHKNIFIARSAKKAGIKPPVLRKEKRKIYGGQESITEELP